jgi:putative spermidine/putrescine transport system ATP-binding protein/spermidine/putrescine transport system ATP-binding protein
VARVVTGFGPLHGTLNDPTLKVGDAAAVVVPSEAIDVVGATHGAALAGRGDTLPGRLIGQAVTGHALHLTIGLSDGREIGVESHVDKYAAGWSGKEIVLGWQPGEATVIRAAA